jgi:hypothetical protein
MGDFALQMKRDTIIGRRRNEKDHFDVSAGAADSTHGILQWLGNPTRPL